MSDSLNSQLMTFSIVEPIINPPFKTGTKHFAYVTLIISIVTLLVSSLSPSVPSKIILGLILIFCSLAWIILLVISWNEYYPAHSEIIGQLTLTNDGMEIRESKVKWNEVEHLSFDMHDFKGKRVGYPYPLPAGPCLSAGINNYIRYTHNKNQQEFQLLIHSEVALIQLGGLLKRLYLAKVNFKETLYGSRSYGLKHLNYVDIQSFKKEYIR